MTTFTKKEAATAAKIAAMEFAPWDVSPEERLAIREKLGTDEMIANGQIVIVALDLLKLSKPEFIAKFKGLNSLIPQRKGEDSCRMRVIHDLEIAQSFFEGCVDVIEAALARLTIVAAASNGNDGTESASC